jgi:hypothetical protein
MSLSPSLAKHRAVGNVDVATDHHIAVHVDTAEPVDQQASSISMYSKIKNSILYRLRGSSLDSGYRPNAIADFVRNQPQTRIRTGYLEPGVKEVMLRKVRVSIPPS